MGAMISIDIVRFESSKNFVGVGIVLFRYDPMIRHQTEKRVNNILSGIPNGVVRGSKGPLIRLSITFLVLSGATKKMPQQQAVKY
jgi:hypothetical protein